jgi:anti-sigma-K factor RskA
MTVLFYLVAVALLVAGVFRGTAAFQFAPARQLAASTTFWISVLGLCFAALCAAGVVYSIARFDERVDSAPFVATLTLISGRGAMLCAVIAAVGHVVLSASRARERI